MLAMLGALWVAHGSGGLGAGQTIKSTIGWMKGWGLLAAFPLVGACLSIRPALVIRATMWLALQTLLITPILVAAALAHLPQRLYVSPLQAVGGPGPEFFAVQLYLIDPSNGALRWQFIAPWAPAAGMIGDMIFVLAVWESDRRFKAIGLAASVLICLMTMSRMAILFLVFFPPILWLLARLSRPGLHAAGALLSLGLSVSAETVIGKIRGGVEAFRSARADSTRVREALGRIAIDRWWDEAPIWGHGIVERGPHHVEFMPIGSHHTWFGLLFVKGAVGVVALAVPMIWTFCEMILLAQVDSMGRLGLSILLMLAFYSAGENLEVLAYLYWPGLVLLGHAFRTAATLGNVKNSMLERRTWENQSHATAAPQQVV